MDDREFLEALKDDDAKEQEFLDAAASFVAQRDAPAPPEPPLEKQAVDPEQVRNFMQTSGRGLGFGAAVGLLGGGLAYAGSRKRKDGTSGQEEATRRAAEYLHEHTDENSGMGKKLTTNTADFMHNLAQTFEQHPVKASGLAALLFGAGGYGASRLFGRK